MTGLLFTHDHYLLAAIALFGTLGAAGFFLWVAHCSRFAARVATFRGISPPFVNVVGVLFALTLAFLANDTWNAHDRAVTATYHEAGGLRTILALSSAIPTAQREIVAGAVTAYAAAAHGEWKSLAHRQASDATTQAMARLQEALSQPDLTRALAQATHAEILSQAVAVRDAREQRIALSQTHVNPLKWLGMAFLGLVTMISIAMVYVDQLRAEILAVALFALAAAPTAAIVLVQGNPFQPPGAVSAEPLAVLAGRQP